MKKKSAKLKKQTLGGERLDNFGSEKFLDFYWCKFEENKSVPVGVLGGGGKFTALFRKKKCVATLPW